ncbi:MAG: M15 family metallopeptidase, partial [Myxococcota bacterium]
MDMSPLCLSSTLPARSDWVVVGLCATLMACGADPIDEEPPSHAPVGGVEALTGPVTSSSQSLAEAMEAQQQATEMLEGALREVSGPPIRTVGELVERRTCSTELTEGLNIQLAAQMNCIRPGFFEPVNDVGNLDLGPAANPFLQAPAAQALREAASADPEAALTINSSWRSVAQQHILKRWKGSCGIRVVADPGTSHHESGLAIDVPTETTRDFRSHLKREGWVWYCDATNKGRAKGCRDRPHYTYKRSGEDLRSLNVLAFQKLWNHAHPDDTIKETG